MILNCRGKFCHLLATDSTTHTNFAASCRCRERSCTPAWQLRSHHVGSTQRRVCYPATPYHRGNHLGQYPCRRTPQILKVTGSARRIGRPRPLFSADRYWTCVALYPNCHRAAHFHPEGNKSTMSYLHWQRGLNRPKASANSSSKTMPSTFCEAEMSLCPSYCHCPKIGKSMWMFSLLYPL